MSTFIGQLVGFAVIVLIITKFVVPPVRKLMANQQEAVRTQLAESAASAQRLAAADSSIDRAWNELLLEVPPRTLAKLHQLKAKGYKLALLSNTNPIHIDEVRRRLGPHGYAAFERCFERVFYSFDMGLRKPDPAIYAAVDRELGITSPAEVLFVDDNAANIASAAAYGWRTLHFV